MPRQGARTLLLIDDEPAQARLIVAVAARAGWRTVGPVAPTSARLALAAEPADAVLIDDWQPGAPHAALIADLRAHHPSLPILMLTPHASVSAAVEAMRAGATDFLVKPIAPPRLIAALEAATDGHVASGELSPLAEKIEHPLGFEELVGAAPAFRTAIGIAAKAARARVPVLIEGEAGVGKEVLARAIHGESPRAQQTMLTVSCAAVPPNQLESELFGHEQGAFTGAFDRRVGRFGEADGGTLFLDEVGALTAEAQLKLLRVLQSGEIQPLGARHAHEVDVRVIAAANHRLADDVAAGRFREDLYYRLAVVQIDLPPLRERRADVPALARHLLARIAAQPGMRSLGISEEAMALLMAYRWPGNVRQLHNTLFRAAVLCRGSALTAADFPALAREIEAPAAIGRVASVPVASAVAVSAAQSIALFEPNGHIRPLEEIEADVIRLAISHYRGRMSEVARRLGIGRSTLYRRLSELGLDSVA